MISSLRFVTLYVLLAAAAFFMATHKDSPTPLAIPLEDFPRVVGEWRMIGDAQFDPETLKILRPTDYMARRYKKADGTVADIYVGYHDGASKAGPLHSPRNCLPGSGWVEVSTEKKSIPISGKDLDAVMAVYQHGEVADLFIYWFQVGGKVVSNEYELKISEVLNSIKNSKRDTSFIRISVAMAGDKSSAANSATDFLRTIQPILVKFLPS